MKQIALFGGSFDPIHAGHVKLASFLLDALALDELVILPAAVSPFKTERGVTASDEDRLSMCRLAFSDPKVTVSDHEIQKGGVSYSVDTVSAFAERHPDDRLFFVVGEDQLLQFHKWYRYRDILANVTLLAVRRERTTENATLSAYLSDHPEIGEHTRLLDFDPLSVSSTNIRSAVADCRDVSTLLPPAVETYIFRHGLYADPEVRTMIADIRGKLSDFRFFHSMCVAECARKLALQYGADPKKAYIAGVLHDSMKEVKREESLAYMEAEGLPVTEAEQFIKKLHHAITGARYAEKTYAVSPEIVSAIRYHTTGKAGMTTFEKILFVADFISADREYPGVDALRQRAGESLESVMEEGLRFTIEDLAHEDRPIHPDTVAAYNEILLEKIKKEQTK